MRRGGVCLVVAIGVLSGCAVNSARVNSFVDPTSRADAIRSLAVFPIRNARAAPAEAQQLNRRIGREIARRRGAGLEMVNAADVVSLLGEHGLADDWADFYEGYVIGGVPDVERLRAFGDAMDVDAIIQGEVVSVYQVDGAWGRNQGETRVTVQFSLLDARDGTLMWEASADGVRKTPFNSGQAPPIGQAIDLAVAALIDNMPRLGSGRGETTEREVRTREQYGEPQSPGVPVEPDELAAELQELRTYAGGEVDGVVQATLRAMTGLGYHTIPTRMDHDCYSGFDGELGSTTVTTLICENPEPPSESLRWEIAVIGEGLGALTELRRALDQEFEPNGAVRRSIQPA